MRAYTICLWFVIFNMSLALVNELQVFTMMSGGSDFTFYTSDLGQIEGASNMTMDGLGEINMLSVLVTIVKSLWGATAGLPFMLSSLGVPAVLVPILTAPAWYCYVAAIVQLTTGRIFPLFE